MILACGTTFESFFNLEPLSTSNLLTIIQIVAVIAGFSFSVRSIKATRESIKVASDSLKIAAQNFDLGTKNAQAQLFNQLVLQGRDLRFKFSEFFHDSTTERGREQRRDHFIGTVIGYYSACFELKNVLTLPSRIEKLLEADLKEFMRDPEVRTKWESIKDRHSLAFGKYVNELREGVK